RPVSGEHGDAVDRHAGRDSNDVLSVVQSSDAAGDPASVAVFIDEAALLAAVVLRTVEATFDAGKVVVSGVDAGVDDGDLAAAHRRGPTGRPVGGADTLHAGRRNLEAGLAGSGQRAATLTNRRRQRHERRRF